MLDILTQVLAACIVSYAIAVLMPSWRALLVATLIVVLLTAFDGIRHWWSPASDRCHGTCTLNDLLAIPLLPIARAGFLTGAAIRALTFLPHAQRLSSRAIIMILVAGGPIAIAIVLFAPNVVFWHPPRLG